MLLIHWYTYKACIVTKLTNYYCGLDINRPFYDYIKLLDIKIKNIYWHLIYLIIFYDICLILSK